MHPLVLFDDVLDGAAVREDGVRHARPLLRPLHGDGREHDVVDAEPGHVRRHLRQHARIPLDVLLDRRVVEVENRADVGRVGAGPDVRRQHGEFGAVDDAAAGVRRLALEEGLRLAIGVVFDRLGDEVVVLGAALLADDVHGVTEVAEGADDAPRPEVAAGAGEAVAVDDAERVGHRDGGLARGAQANPCGVPSDPCPSPLTPPPLWSR